MNDFSGKFVLRIQPNLHAHLHSEAKKRGLSLNQYCVEILKKRESLSEDKNMQIPGIKKIIELLNKKFGHKLVGIVLFGSTAIGEATHLSDVDLLIVLDPSLAITRSLYHWWDQHIPFQEKIINPHFVTLPMKAMEISGIWLEIAIQGEILFQRGRNLSSFLNSVKQIIEEDHVRRYWSNGHPYWVWRNNEEQITR